MGSSASVHNIEVSIVDNKTGNILKDEEIEFLNTLSNQIIKQNFDIKYQQQNSYDIWKTYLEENDIYRTNFKWN